MPTYFFVVNELKAYYLSFQILHTLFEDIRIKQAFLSVEIKRIPFWMEK